MAMRLRPSFEPFVVRHVGVDLPSLHIDNVT
jgi:hypothetical protein